MQDGQYLSSLEAVHGSWHRQDGRLEGHQEHEHNEQGLAAGSRTHHLVLFHAALHDGANADRRRHRRSKAQARLDVAVGGATTTSGGLVADGEHGVTAVGAERMPSL